ncbi:MAG: M48 family metallopeptidase [Myxococcota bacterium]
MNFFEEQDRAHRNTGRLILLFGSAVLATVVGVYLVIRVVLFFNRVRTEAGHMNAPNMDFAWWSPEAFLLCLVGTVVVVGGGTWWKINQLAKGGGSLVCEELGGRFLDFRTNDRKEQMFINVVEEMSIASGVSVPLLYVLDDEKGINAFAAGFSPNEAAIAVSRGCLELLNRDELQGVVAHEFSHILNGDMRMNIRMMGILHGILMIALTGSIMMRLSLGTGSSRRSRRNSDGGVIYLIVIGLALYIIGYVGRFFGQIIKSALSRQREYLADASAVQFTRNPKGIAGALKKIGGYDQSSRIDNPNADECSHFFFGDALERNWLTSVFATHPPLKDRIRKVDPGFSGAFTRVDSTALDSDGARGQLEWSTGSGMGATAGVASGLAGADAGAGATRGQAHERQAASSQAQPNTYRVNPDEVVDKVGRADAQQVDHARQLLASMPEELRADARDTYSAASVVFALLIDSDDRARELQYEILGAKLTEGLARETRRRVKLLTYLREEQRLPMVEILIPALRQMSTAQHDQFVSILDDLIFADDQVSLFEFCLEKLLYHRLEPTIQQGGASAAQFYSLTPLREDITVLFSRLAYIGHDTTDGAQRAFRAGMAQLDEGDWTRDASLLAESHCTFTELERALDRIGDSSNGVKKRIVQGIAHVVLADDEVTVGEAEILRAVCEVIDVPLPPFLPDT